MQNQKENSLTMKNSNTCKETGENYKDIQNTALSSDDTITEEQTSNNSIKTSIENIRSLKSSGISVLVMKVKDDTPVKSHSSITLRKITSGKLMIHKDEKLKNRNSHENCVPLKNDETKKKKNMIFCNKQNSEANKATKTISDTSNVKYVVAVNCSENEMKTEQEKNESNTTNSEDTINSKEYYLGVNTNDTKGKKGSLFLNKRRKFFKNLIFAKKGKMKPDDIKIEVVNSGSCSKSLYSMSEHGSQESDTPTFYSSTILKNNTNLQLNDGILQAVIEDDEGEECDRNSDYEMVVLFMGQNHKSEKMGIASKTNVRKGVNVPKCLTNKDSSFIKSIFNRKSLDRVKTVDKTTSTSNLENYTTTFIPQTETICESTEPTTKTSTTDSSHEITETKSVPKLLLDSESIECTKTSGVELSIDHIEDDNISSCEQSLQQITDKKEDNLLEKTEEEHVEKFNANYQARSKITLLSRFINPHIIMSNKIKDQYPKRGDLTDNPCVKQGGLIDNEGHSKDAYASFRKSYISVSKSIGPKTDDGQMGSDGNSYRSYYEQIESISLPSYTSENIPTSDISNIQEYSSDQKVNVNQDMIPSNKSEIRAIPQIKNEYLSKINTQFSKFLYEQNTDMHLNLLDDKFNIIDKVYSQRIIEQLKKSEDNRELSCKKYTGVTFNETDTNTPMITDVKGDTQNYKSGSETSECNQYITNDESDKVAQSEYYLNLNPSTLGEDSEKMTVKSMTFKSEINNHTNSLLSRQFKRDYISVRGKSVKIKYSDNFHVPHKTKLNKVLKEKSAFNLQKMYKEFANDACKFRNKSDARNELREFLKSSNTLSNEFISNHTQTNTKMNKQSSKLSLCISQESVGETSDDYMNEKSDTNDEKPVRDIPFKNQEETLGTKNLRLKIPERKRILFPRIYSDFSIESKCNSKAYKYLFYNFKS